MGPFRYLVTVLNRAAQGSLTLTDRLSVLLVPFTTLVLWASGRRITENVAVYIGIAIALTVIAIVALRLVASTYLVWLSDQSEKATMATKLQEERGRLDRYERELATQEVAALRNELGEHLSRMMVCAEFAALPSINAESQVERAQVYLRSMIRCREIINSLSFDMHLRVSAHHLVAAIAELMAMRIAGENTDDLSNTVQAIKRNVFSIIYKRDASAAAEFISFMEIEGIMRDGVQAHHLGPTINTENVADKFSELRDMLRSDPDLAHVLKTELKAAGPAGFSGITKGTLEDMSPEGRAALLRMASRLKANRETQDGLAS